MFRSRLTRSAGIALAVTALGASTAVAQPIDYRAPVAIDAGTPAAQTTKDLRTPDAVDAGTPVTATTAGTDLRTPDAVDHGLGRGTFSAPDVTVVKVVDPPPTAGFDWSDAGIGAGGLLGLILVGLGGTLVVTHRRHSRMPLAG